MSTDLPDPFAVARADLGAFCALMEPGFELAPHVEILVSTLESVERGECRRLIIALPPRHGKSMLCSQLFPAWYLGRNPRASVIAASHSQDLTDLFGRRSRNLMLDPRFPAVFPQSRLSEDSQAASRFDLRAGGTYYGVGRGVAVTGRGANLIVIDDPLRDAAEAASATIRASLLEWFRTSIFTRQAPGASIIVVSTRWPEADLAGTLLAESPDDWKVISLPALAEPGDLLGREEGAALWPEKFPAEALAKIRTQIGGAAWASLYQRRPAPVEGAVFKRAWFGVYRKDTLRGPECSRVVQAWDTAFKASSRPTSPPASRSARSRRVGSSSTFGATGSSFPS